ncbi:hypothetical protein [Streptomyces sp. NBC_01727]|uniref:hypothetical protein n=1 Tax=Streptomyces sp. NBC_01727 TaxID=2975924 RepID=UPI002E0DAA73|nr:hypothetical protein OIE76_38220 [Streptomyces sp. NBC_01727]
MDDNGKARTLTAPELQNVLSLLLDQVDPDALGLDYRLVGTGAALAQGVQLPVNDVDILMIRRRDVDRTAAALSGFPCRDSPVWLPDARQYFARFEVAGIEVEISTVERSADTDTLECVGRGPWEHFVGIWVGRHLVPAVGLELRLVTELVRDRPDRYEPLMEHMRLHGADLPLLRKAMGERAVDPAWQEHILEQLQQH